MSRVQGLEFIGPRVKGLRIEGSGFRLMGLGFRDHLPYIPHALRPSEGENSGVPQLPAKLTCVEPLGFRV